MTPARFRWGLILIQLGILILLVNLEVINYNFFFEALVFIAVVLIMVGIEKIFARSRLQIISYLSSVGIFIFGFLIAFDSSLSGPDGAYLSETIYRAEYETGVKKINAKLNFGDADLKIRDAGNDLVYGRFDRFTRKPRIKFSVDEGTADVTMDGRSGNLLGGAIIIDTDDSREWYLRFSDEVPLDLECFGRESEIHLNMSTTPLERLRVEADDADIYLLLGDLLPNVSIIIDGEDSKLRLRVPEEIGLRIKGEDYEGLMTAIGLLDAGDGAFVTEGYDTLQTKVQIELDERLKSVMLDRF